MVVCGGLDDGFFVKFLEIFDVVVVVGDDDDIWLWNWFVFVKGVEVMNVVGYFCVRGFILNLDWLDYDMKWKLVGDLV